MVVINKKYKINDIYSQLNSSTHLFSKLNLVIADGSAAVARILYISADHDEIIRFLFLLSKFFRMYRGTYILKEQEPLKQHDTQITQRICKISSLNIINCLSY